VFLDGGSAGFGAPRHHHAAAGQTVPSGGQVLASGGIDPLQAIRQGEAPAIAVVQAETAGLAHRARQIRDHRRAACPRSDADGAGQVHGERGRAVEPGEDEGGVLLLPGRQPRPLRAGHRQSGGHRDDQAVRRRDHARDAEIVEPFEAATADGEGDVLMQLQTACDRGAGGLGICAQDRGAGGGKIPAPQGTGLVGCARGLAAGKAERHAGEGRRSGRRLSRGRAGHGGGAMQLHGATASRQPRQRHLPSAIARVHRQGEGNGDPPLVAAGQGEDDLIAVHAPGQGRPGAIARGHHGQARPRRRRRRLIAAHGQHCRRQRHGRSERGNPGDPARAAVDAQFLPSRPEGGAIEGEFAHDFSRQMALVEVQIDGQAAESEGAGRDGRGRRL